MPTLRSYLLTKTSMRNEKVAIPSLAERFEVERENDNDSETAQIIILFTAVEMNIMYDYINSVAWHSEMVSTLRRQKTLYNPGLPVSPNDQYILASLWKWPNDFNELLARHLSNTFRMDNWVWKRLTKFQCVLQFIQKPKTKKGENTFGVIFISIKLIACAWAGVWVQIRTHDIVVIVNCC